MYVWRGMQCGGSPVQFGLSVEAAVVDCGVLVQLEMAMISYVPTIHDWL